MGGTDWGPPEIMGNPIISGGKSVTGPTHFENFLTQSFSLFFNAILSKNSLTHLRGFDKTRKIDILHYYRLLTISQKKEKYHGHAKPIDANK